MSDSRKRTLEGDGSGASPEPKRAQPDDAVDFSALTSGDFSSWVYDAASGWCVAPEGGWNYSPVSGRFQAPLPVRTLQNCTRSDLQRGVPGNAHASRPTSFTTVRRVDITITTARSSSTSHTCRAVR
jgi:hypothetical protein